MISLMSSNTPGRLTTEALSHYYISPFYEALMVSSPIAIVVLDLQGKVESCNPAFRELFGYSQEEVIGEVLDPLITDETTYLEAAENTRCTIQLGKPIRVVSMRFAKDHTPVHVDIQGIPVFRDGEQTGVLALFHDITHLKKTETALREAYQSLFHIMNSIDADVYVADFFTHKIEFMNHHMISTFGNQVGQTCFEKFRGESTPCSNCSLTQLLDKDLSPTQGITWEGFNTISGKWYKNSDRAILWNDGRFMHLQIAVDITEIKESEKKLEHLATHDPLTGLPNRIYFQAKLDHSLATAKREKVSLAVMFFDLDRFKDVNDELGHHSGDILLKLVAERIQSCLRIHDTVARVSGDEFCIILENIVNQADITQIADRIIHIFDESFNIEGNTLTVCGSLGISVYPKDGEDGDLLLRQADSAMYKIKRCGGKSYGFFKS